MLPIDQLIKKLAPVIGEDKANGLLYKYNSLQNLKLKRKFEDQTRLLCYKLLGNDFEEKILLEPPAKDDLKNEINLGKVIYNEKSLYDFGLSNKELLMHTAILGRSGSGKTNIAFKFIQELKRNKCPFLIFDWKKNYRNLISGDKEILVFTPGAKTSPFYFNPLIPPYGITPEIWKEMLCAAIGYSYFIGEGALTVLEKGIDKAYEDFGVYTGLCQEYPTFKDVAKRILSKGQSRGREMLWMQSCSRVLHSLTNSTLAESINVSKNPIPLASTLQNNIVMELDYLAPSNKIFLTQALLLWMYHYRLNQPKAEKLEHEVIIEEAQNLLLKGKEELKSGNIMPKIIREFRELGIGLCFIAQEVSKINTTVLQNCYTLIALNQRYRNDIELLGSSMSLKRYEWDYLGKIPIGSGIVNMKGEFPGSFLVRFPLVKGKADISDSNLKKHMEQAYFSKFRHKLSPFKKESGFHQFSKKANLSSPTYLGNKNKEDILLLEVLEHPFVSVTEHYSNLGLNYREANHVKKALLDKGMMVEEKVQEGIVRKKILSLTEKGKEHLRKKGWKVSKEKTNAGPSHEYWKSSLNKSLKKKGYKTREESRVKNGNKRKAS